MQPPPNDDDRNHLEPTSLEKLELVGRVLDLLPDFFYVHDYDLRFLYANQKAATYFGKANESELYGKTLVEVDPDKAQAEQFVKVCREVMDAQQPRITDNLPYRTPTGKTGVLRQYDIPFINPKTGKKMLIGLSRDVTHERELEQQRLRAATLEHELAIAQQIQAGLRPTAQPANAHGLDLAAFSQAAVYAGGDFYDWLTLPDGRIAVCMGDVTGHGVGPALIASACRAYARVLLATLPLAAAMQQLDALLASDLRDGHFVTFAAVLLDPRTFTAEVLSAGQGPLLHVHAKGTTTLNVQYPPLGLLSLQSSDALNDPPQTITLAPGDAIAMISDGLYEACNPSNESLGIARVAAALARAHGSPGASIIASLMALQRAHTQDKPLEDDVTLVWLGRSLLR